jgi:hypothetical protein
MTLPEQHVDIRAIQEGFIDLRLLTSILAVTLCYGLLGETTSTKCICIDVQSTSGPASIGSLYVYPAVVFLVTSIIKRS